VGDFLREWGLAAFGALATLGASVILVRAGRRDHAENKQEKLEAKIEDLGEDYAHMAGHLQAKTGYQPRR
jgi:uncharacterized pyridoxal phosphate-containing UPF0001 family protein